MARLGKGNLQFTGIGMQAANAQAELSRGLAATSVATPAPPQGTQQHNNHLHQMQQPQQQQQPGHPVAALGEAAPALCSMPNKATVGLQQGQFWQRKATPLEQSLAIQDPFAAALGLEALASGGKDTFEQVGGLCETGHVTHFHWSWVTCHGQACM
mgnify:CR=1 FL=1